MKIIRIAGAALVLLALPGLAEAHPDPTHAVGLVHGFIHPLTGIDHILAMVAVGMLAAHMGGRALWALPLSFMGMMAVGGVLGVAGVAIPYVEVGIAVSVIVLGAAVALRVQWPLAATMGLVGLFAIFHGHAHGAEMPETASGLVYGVGFLVATASLHATGVALGYFMGSRASAARLMRVAGVAMGLVGIVLLSGAI
jgi:urease accessory protein